MALLKESKALVDYMLGVLKWDKMDALSVGMICADRASPLEAEMTTEMLCYLKDHPSVDIETAIEIACGIREKRFGKQKFIVPERQKKADIKAAILKKSEAGARIYLLRKNNGKIPRAFRKSLKFIKEMSVIMRVKYIGDYYKVSLIKGKLYEVISIERGWYRIVDETDEDYLFPPDMFEIVEK